MNRRNFLKNLMSGIAFGAAYMVDPTFGNKNSSLLYFDQTGGKIGFNLKLYLAQGGKIKGLDELKFFVDGLEKEIINLKEEDFTTRVLPGFPALYGKHEYELRLDRKSHKLNVDTTGNDLAPGAYLTFRPYIDYKDENGELLVKRQPAFILECFDNVAPIGKRSGLEEIKVISQLTEGKKTWIHELNKSNEYKVSFDVPLEYVLKKPIFRATVKDPEGKIGISRMKFL